MKLKNALSLLKYKFAAMPVGQYKYCCICNSRIGRFLPYEGGWRNVPPMLKALGIVGSDPDNFSCPKCGSHDRERHLVLYLNKLGLLKEMSGAVVLHFAPEQCLSRFIAGRKPVKYVKADLFPTSPDVEKIDMLAIPYSDCTFDWVFANHVLEHVPDEIKALSELHRVLRRGGYAVLQTPYCEKLKKTFNDDAITDPEARLQAYGQADHVRLFGLDIFKKITETGFESCVSIHQQVLADVDATYYGVNLREPLMLFKKS